jgi:hypothetical protein
MNGNNAQSACVNRGVSGRADQSQAGIGGALVGRDVDFAARVLKTLGHLFHARLGFVR